MVPLEDEEQETVVEYLELRGLKFTAIPNSTFTKSWSQKNKNRRVGLRAGLPDLLIALPGTGILFIEMKRLEGSTTSAKQKAWIETLNKCPGAQAYVCKGAVEAIAIIDKYLPSGVVQVSQGSVF
jgi:hypothetical protein